MKRLHIVFLFFLVINFSFSLSAQTVKPTPTPKTNNNDEGEIIKVNSRLVVVPVSVLDADGNPVLGLKTEDFRVAEENRNQQIEQVSDAEKIPLEIVLLFDVSASTDSMFKFEQETAAKFLQEVMRPEDHATIFTIGEKPFLVQAREAADKSALAVKSIQPTKEQTAFYDSVAAAANFLQKNAPQNVRKVILVISDGDDTNSAGVIKAIFNAEMKIVEGSLSNKELRDLRVKARDSAKIQEQNKVLQSLQNADTVFYSINPGGNSYQLNQSSVFGQSNLQRFAEETGGTAFLPKFQPVELKDSFQNTQNMRLNSEMLSKIFRQLANELRAQYLIQYYSETEYPNNKYVKLDVGLASPNKLRVRARQGYFVKN